ncbi:hypothetical protein DFJ63DRAFT_311375 [Scheffersomyces coipomensis]|uniref:uncharacterized protein n=1 Tax=Scheffersomyces coipomensis TaxID=1788519 RepID=UPI00315C6E7E
MNFNNIIQEGEQLAASQGGSQGGSGGLGSLLSEGEKLAGGSSGSGSGSGSNVNYGQLADDAKIAYGDFSKQDGGSFTDHAEQTYKDIQSNHSSSGNSGNSGNSQGGNQY